MIPEITDNDIIDLKKRHPTFSLDDERINFLKQNTPFILNACPGSGKTTLIGLKLLLLSKKWIYKTKGVCVVSHTNVAKNEIIKIIKSQYDGYCFLEYPHFIGTMHSFVKKFQLLDNKTSDDDFAKYFKDANNKISINHQLSNILSSRFPLVIIDEMQDTDKEQNLFFKTCFYKSIVQEYGDKNQYIKYEDQIDDYKTNNMFYLSSTNRLPPKITQLIKPLMVSNNESFVSTNSNFSDCKIILFNNKKDVLLTFDKIVTEQLIKIKNSRNLLICAVGEQHSEIQQYYTAYRSEKDLNSEFNKSGIHEILILHRSSNNLIKAKDSLIEFISHRPNINWPIGINKFSQFIRYIRSNPENNIKVYELNKIIYYLLFGNIFNEKMWNEKITIFINLINNLLFTSINRSDKVFLFDKNINMNHFSGNIFKGLNDIKVRTIHACKGETHYATLVLEGKDQRSNKYDLKEMINILIDKDTLLSDKKKQKFIFTACSRPTALLCLAIYKDHVSIEERNCLEKKGWEIIEI